AEADPFAVREVSGAEDRFIHHGGDLLCVAEQPLARRGEFHAVGVAAEKRPSHRGLQLADLAAGRGLTHAEPPRRAGEALLGTDRDEGAEMALAQLGGHAYQIIR